ncbi:hypothetical protein OSB04_012326 [Centaurea solstitialis]|uniref:Protein kinase domain-containing protein n=1 Tax=Centaurea solstitialis TaxID=347529 RepID=A0AA38TU81_9ASTR|nr:hypothetical protein OSB04_012326 [Centaurea solstitialis]
MVCLLQSEVNFLGRLSHPNVVKLLGYCRDERDLLLVCEFLQKGSLENHLLRRKEGITKYDETPNLLSKPKKLVMLCRKFFGSTALVGSKAENSNRLASFSNAHFISVLAFLIIDLCRYFFDYLRNYTAKISDFGLAKLSPSGGMSHVTTRVMGTYGHAAPEYIATCHLYVKSDVYGFGVVLLEMMTGLRALDTKRPGPQHSLVEWSKPMLPNRKKLKTIMDARIEGQYTSKAAMLFAQLVLHCLESEPQKRPS